MTDKPPTEPAAVFRTPANALWQLYVALTNEGFSEKQALQIIGFILSTQMGKQ